MQRTIAVVGGGAAGVILSAHLLRAAASSGRAGHSVQVLLVDPAETPGRGLPYRTTDPRHTLNAVVARLSAFDDDPEHLLRWCASAGVPAEPGTFLQRADFGRYLTELLPSIPVPEGSSLRHVRGTVVDVVDGPDAGGGPGAEGRPGVAGGPDVGDGPGIGGGGIEGGPGVVLTLADGGTLRADAAVLALGTPPPVRLPEYEPWGERYVADPWSPDLDERAADARRVLVVGTGLTTLDVVAHLHALLPDARFTAVSRGGTLPAAHAADPLPPAVEVDLGAVGELGEVGSDRAFDGNGAGNGTDSGNSDGNDGRNGTDGGDGGDGAPAAFWLGATLDHVRRHIAGERAAGRDWRAVIDAVRPQVNPAWARLTADEQATFQRDHARSWENVRHRMSHAMRTHVDQLVADGVLTVGTVAEARDANGADGQGGANAQGGANGQGETNGQGGADRPWNTAAFDLVVGATGLPPLTSPGWNPLVDALLARGLVRLHRLGTGLDLTPDAALIDAAGVGHPRLRAMGLARRGLEWECTSIPDLRRQSAQLSDELLG
ncbi:putative NAD(P)/FAD-binding protein YdhS [Promicromonospora sp. AC04]|uniref:FAD/NAD(P)-binding protein n=1 Tax=Promicromonospora sp. AC04 TaxID=2135723 RepID=UPI000D393AAF|nr:FAD/NAD(P)-binding protein [Promicromonospora sp. AC04]PUB26245.1 putative NAD(P)/FAD-binding protein YdhS [Promicromonospora sp. AC04]